jgi:hypothetical protein
MEIKDGKVTKLSKIRRKTNYMRHIDYLGTGKFLVPKIEGKVENYLK